MTDNYGRTINYLRISLTDRCNMRCVYCMPEEGILQKSHSEILTYDEIGRICRVMAGEGITRVKLTGGEPLVRRRIWELVRSIKQIPGIEQVTLTTNGVLLGEQMELLADAGIDGINLSLDTLDPERYAEITRRDLLQEALRGLRAAMEHPEIPLKINCVPMFSDGDNYIRLAELARNAPVHVRFIEMMPIGYGKQFPFLRGESIRKILEEAFGELTPAPDCVGNGPARYFSIEGFQGKIGFISAVTHRFCGTCNRVRLTSEGYLKLCLQYEEGIDLKGRIRGGCTDGELAEAIREAIQRKPFSHHFYEEIGEARRDEERIMSQIGG